jgi:hypothetical protein
MNHILFGIVIIAFQFLTAVALLYLAGGLIEFGLHQDVNSGPRYPKGSWRLIRDLQGLEDAFVQFFARSNESCSVLSVLAATQQPLNSAAIARETGLAENRQPGDYSLSPAIAFAVLSVLLLAGLVSVTRQGFLLSEVGREVYKRIKSNPASGAEGDPSPEGTRMSKRRETLKREPAISRLTTIPQPGITVPRSTTVRYRLPHRTFKTQEKL